MKLHVMSDIHLEFTPYTPPQTGADVVILAGDTHPGTKGVRWAMDTFQDKPVLYLLGNHEYYGQAYPKHIAKLKELANGSNVVVLENDCFIYNEIVFLGCTLWTDFALFGNPRVAGYYAAQSGNDYRKIRINPSFSRLRSIDTAGIHFRSRIWLNEQFTKYHNSKIVVVTHHAPSKLSLPEADQDDILSAAKASNLDALIENTGSVLWIHGHLHLPSDYQIGSTRIISNPRGYPGEQQTDFTPDLIIVV
jgi:predicted phosphohydrolase